MNAKDYWELYRSIESLTQRIEVLEVELKRKADKPGRKPNIAQDTKDARSPSV